MDELQFLLPLLPIVTGVSGQYGVFIGSRKEFRERLQLAQKKLKESLAIYLADLLRRLVLLEDELLRGDEHTPDLVIRYTNETWKTFDLLGKVARLNAWFKVCQGVLFATTLGAIGLVVLVLLKKVTADAIVIATVVLLVVQALAASIIYLVSDWFEKYEQAA